MTRVVIVDDDLFVRTTLGNELRAAGIDVRASYASGRDAVAAVRDDRPDVALVDVVMPDPDGPATTRLLREASPRTQVLALTSLTDPKAAAAMLSAGALGFLPKDLSPEAIVHAVQSARHGLAVLGGAGAGMVERRHRSDVADTLTSTDRRILGMIREGRTTDEISRGVFLSPSTVKYHINALMEKLGATNRVTLAIRAYEIGL